MDNASICDGVGLILSKQSNRRCGIHGMYRSNAEGGGCRQGAARGLDAAFATATRVQEWLRLDHGPIREDDGTSEFHENLPQLRGPFGHLPVGRLPAVVWVSLPALGYDPALLGGIRRFVGEPLQRWQEKGVPFYFVKFQGTVGFRKVRVSDCEAVDAPEGVVEPSGGPSSDANEHSDGSGIPEFPTHRLHNDAPMQMHMHPHNDLAPQANDVALEVDNQPGLIERGELPLHEECSTTESSEDDWHPNWRDFAGDASSLDCNDSEGGSTTGSVDFRHEIGEYDRDGDLDVLDFRERYHDRFWQCPESTLLGDRESFRGPEPGPKARVHRIRSKAIHFFHLFFDDKILDKMVEQTNLYASQ